MRTPLIILSILSLSSGQQPEVEMKEVVESISETLTENQDNLTADIQELVELQTQSKVIEKLEEVEVSMAKATLNLLSDNTSERTIAIQTDIIEKAYEAAQQRNKGKGKSDTDKAMMKQLQKMLGKQDEDGSPENVQEPGTEPSDSSGDGKPLAETKETDFEVEKRTVPAASAYTGELLPEEFSELIDPYNNGE